MTTMYWLYYDIEEWAIIIEVSGKRRGGELTIQDIKVLFNNSGNVLNVKKFIGKKLSDSYLDITQEDFEEGAVNNQREVVKLIFEEIF